MICIAIDDEPIALSIIEKYCERRGGMEIETFSKPLVGLRRICEVRPDVVFLDIELNGVSGIELARQLPPSCCLIFTTAYAAYALDGFEVNAVDFLHKPYFYERFERAVAKAEQWLRMNDLLATSVDASRQLRLKSGYRTVNVAVDNIVYIESLDNYVKIHVADGKAVLSKMSLSGIEAQLPPKEFVRIHRSFIVARSRIDKFSKAEITLQRSEKSLPIGKTYSKLVAQALNIVADSEI